MPYSQFTLHQAVETFDLTVVEGTNLFTDIIPVEPSPLLRDTLADNVPWAAAVSNGKARSEALINPILLEVRRLYDRQISVFSGEEFVVDPDANLTGHCDFLISKSSEQLFIKAPVVVIVEARQEDTKLGLGQCVAEMVAAQQFNRKSQPSVTTVYGSVSSGTAWKFLKIEGQTVTIDLNDYSMPPVDVILGVLSRMVKEG